MALNTVYETWVKKQAQINKKQLEMAELVTQLNAAITPLQSQIETARASYQDQVGVLNSDIAQLEADIKGLALS